jgi:hypothetical protein
MEGFFFLLYNTKYISQTLGFCDQVPEKSNLREERFILLTVSEVTVHHGGEGIVEYLP